MSNMVFIEAQTSGGNWIKVSECANRPQIIKQIFDAQMRSNQYTKFRAVDPITKALIDIAFKA